MSEEEYKSISIMIAGRAYPLKVKMEDEEAIRQVVNELNEKIKHFQITYSNRDKQDCLSMALLTYAVDFHKAVKNTDEKRFNERLDKLDQLLDAILN
jgi:cell division protein ZapA (FtsZ GTPase activity inhibitor)